MGEQTKIEWADHTWNPWIGCQKVGKPCDFCYAEELMDTRYGRVVWGPHGERVRTSPHTWNNLRRWNKAARAAGERRFVFSLSLGDIWDNKVPAAWRREAFDMARECESLVMLYLSKRIGNAVDMAREAGGLPPNAALGSTFGDQEDYDRDRIKLHDAARTLGALFAFGSFEPLLGPVILDRYAPDWIIVGGESGRSARPMALDWARSIRRQAADLGRVFNFKQVGGRTADKGGHTLDGRTHFDRPALPTSAETPPRSAEGAPQTGRGER
jgi:protein gp37